MDPRDPYQSFVADGVDAKRDNGAGVLLRNRMVTNMDGDGVAKRNPLYR